MREHSSTPADPARTFPVKNRACGAGCSCTSCKSKAGVPHPAGPAQDLSAEDRIDRIAARALASPSPDHGESVASQVRAFATAQGPDDMAPGPQVQRTLARGGRPLEPTTRGDMEQRFGHRFGHVRIHTDSQAADSASAVAAHAYTVGSQIVFGAGRYDPHGATGRMLLAHELSHVVQQETGPTRLQRWAACRPVRMSAEDCPKREAGEERRAASAAMPFLSITGNGAATTGGLVANFDIGKAAVKRSLRSSLYWKNFLGGLSREKSYWRLIGFSDCHEDEAGGQGLRQRRADAVFDTLPPALQQRITAREAGASQDCVSENNNLSDRAQNRSVAFVHERTEVDFSEEGEGETIEVASYDPARAAAECRAGGKVKTFPFRTTRFGGAPLMTRRNGEMIVVELPMHVRHNDDFRREVATLPFDTFINGTELRKDEVVRVRHYELPHWYNLNVTGDASGDKKTEYCVTGEQMLEFGKASHRATLVNIAVTGVEALAPAAGKVITAPLTKATQKAGQKLLISSTLGTAKAAPTAFGGVASRQTTTIVADRAAATAVERSTVQAVAQTTATTVAERAAPAVATAAPRIASGSASVVGAGTSSAAANIGGGAVQDQADNDIDDAFSPAGDFAEAPYQTTQRLVRGCMGECHATFALARHGHTILSFKPSILGTNQGGIDIITLHNGIVHFIDNKALTRTGNISSVSALTTNFPQNLAAVIADFERRAADHALSAAERRTFRVALDAIYSNNYLRIVTNANVAPDSAITSGITQRLFDLGIRFIDLMR
jgi:Holliday junction resolvase-like predicted endonuclease